MVGATDPTTGQAIVAFAILRGSVDAEGEAGEALIKELRDHVAKTLGPIAKPRQIMLVAGAAEDPLRQDHAAAAARRRGEPLARRRHDAAGLVGDGPDLVGSQQSANPTRTDQQLATDALSERAKRARPYQASRPLSSCLRIAPPIIRCS